MMASGWLWFTLMVCLGLFKLLFWENKEGRVEMAFPWKDCAWARKFYKARLHAGHSPQASLGFGHG